MLWIALELPSLPLQLAERGCPSRSPRAIAEGPAQRPVVACANAAACEAGVRAGQAVAAAKVLCGNLQVLLRDGAVEQESLEQLAAWGIQYTPGVSVDGQGLALEVEASLRLFGGHAKLTAAIRNGIHELGYRATIGIAPTPMAARLFARAEAQGIGVRSCVAIGELGGRIAGLPLFLLDWPQRTLALLADLGILRFKDILALPREGLARRFGPEVMADLDRLTGRLPDPRAPYVPPPTFHVRLELASEVESTQALLFPLRRLLSQMEGFLRGRGAGVQQLTLTLEPVRGRSTRIELAFASPEREADFILALARERLGRAQLAAPTLVIDLRAEALLDYAPRAATWLPGREEQTLGSERLLQRLSARIGRERVFGIALSDDHRPEHGWKGRCVGIRGQTPKPSSQGLRGLTPKTRHFGARPLWLLHRPQKLVSEDGMPLHQGRLDFIAGPERIEAGWWDGEPVARDYFVAANPGGERFWVYREHHDAKCWYLHGVFA